MPVLVPSNADSTVGLNVTITHADPAAQLRYTLNGAEPTLFDPPIVSGGSILISRSATLKVRAWIDGEPSPVVTEDFRITGAVSSGYRHGLALSVTGRVWSWGEQESGRLGNGNTAAADISIPGRVLLPPDNFELGAAIAAGYDHSLVVDQSGILWTFGENGSGQLGNNSTTDSAVPVRVLQSTTAGDFIGPCIAADGGQDYSIALLSTGEVVAWGVQSTGRLGNGTNSSSSRKYAGPVKRGDDPAYPALDGIRAIDAGYGHGMAREPNASEVPAATGRVWVWGRNHAGQLGRGNTSGTTRAFPMLLDATTELTDALDLSGSGSHSVVVRWKAGDPALDGTVWSCGSQSEGRLGNGSTASGNLTYPVQAIKVGGDPLTGIRQVSAGTSYTLALDEDGHVWAWGSNDYGQLGDGTTVDNGHARQVKDAAGTGVLGDIVMISAGGENSRGLSLALAKDGTIWAWGSNLDGQLGNGQTSGISVLPVAHAQNHVAEGELTLTLNADVIEPQALGEMNITADAAVSGDVLDLEDVEVQIFRNGQPVATGDDGCAECLENGLPAGTYHIYAVATHESGLTAMSAVATKAIIDPEKFAVSPLNGSAGSKADDGTSEYWLADGEKSIELNVALDAIYHDSEIIVEAFDSTVDSTGQSQPQTLPTHVVGSGATRRMTIDLYRDADGDPISVVGPVTISAYLREDETELWTEAWTSSYRPRAVTWEISQPITALQGTTPVTLPGTRFRNGEIARLVRSEGGSYKVRSTFAIDTFGDDPVNAAYEMTLRGLPDQLPQIAPGTQSHHDFNFTIPTFALTAPDIRLDLVRSSDDEVIRSTPVSLHGRTSGTGIDYSGIYWKYGHDETTDQGYDRECGNCGNESGTETFSYIDREGSMCATGYLSPDSTTDNKVDASFSLGTSGAGAGGMKADFKTNDLSDPGIASPENMQLSGTESPQVTTDAGGTYAETIETATGTTEVTDIQPDGYTLTFTGTGQSEPTTSLGIVHTDHLQTQEEILTGDHRWSLRFIEKRHLGTVVETRYEQTKHTDGSETWVILEGAELASLSDPAADEDTFLRRTTILRSATAVVSVTPLLGTGPAPIPQFTEQVTVDEMTADTSVWETVSVTLNTFRVYPWGDPIVSQVLDPVTAANPAGRALTRRWDYYTQTNSVFGTISGSKMSARPGTLAGFQDYDGFWQQLEWDGEGRIAKVRSPFLDSPSSAADGACEVWSFTYGASGLTRRDIHKIQGVTVAEYLAHGIVENTRSLVRFAVAGEESPGNPANDVTTITRAPVAFSTGNSNFKFAADSNRITAITRPDGTRHTCEWSYVGATLVKTCKDGNATLTKGTSTVTTTDLIGNALVTVNGVLDFGGAPSTAQTLSTVTLDLLDPLGRPTQRITDFTGSSPDQIESWTYSCCGILNSTDHRGIVTNYHHDHLKRRESSTTLGVVHGTQYNGRERLQLRIPLALVLQELEHLDLDYGRITFRGTPLGSFPAGTILQGETTTNLAGETTLQRSPSPQHADGFTMVATTIAHTYLPNAITRSFPDGGQSVSTWTADRRSRGTHGSAVDEAGLAYSTIAQGNGSVFAETRYLGDYARSGQEYVTTGYDLLGRPVITRYPDGAFATMHYNDLGQLIKSIDPDGVTTLFAYNDEGERTHSAADLNGNGVLDLDFDRVSFSETNAAIAPDGTTYTWQTLSRVYREGDSGESGGLVAGHSYRSIDGLKSWSVPFGLAARTSSSVTVLGGNGAWTSTSLAADGLTTVSTTTGGLLRSSIVRGANAVETVSSTEYFYDDHNRVETTTDARTGATTVAFNNADQATSTTLERGPGTTDDLTTSYAFDEMGRTVEVDSPDTASASGNLDNIVTREYDKRGNVTKISGEQTYDVDYTYDSLSRMKTLTTRYGDANGGQGTAQVTEWVYDPQRGWLVEKIHPGEVNDWEFDPDYTYTVAGRLQTRRWERGVITTYAYASGSGDLSSVSYSDGTPPLAYRYTRWGAVKEIDDYSGTREFAYRTTIDLSLERESQSTAATASFQGWAPKILFHAQDSLGRRTGLRIGGPDISAPDNFAEDHVVQYGYDPKTGRLKDIVHGDTDHGIPEKPFVQSYLTNSHLPSVLSKPVGSEVNGWEPYRDVLKSKDIRNPFATSLARSEYGTPGAANDAVNAIGQRTETNYTGSYILAARRGKSEYAYNANGEVVSAVRKNTAGTPLAGESDGFTFDPIGNRLAATVDGTTATTYAPNPLNQYASIVTGGSTFTPLHDADGNLVNDGIRTYQWDGENRLEEVRRVSDDALIARYSYDYMSRRVFKGTTSAAPQGESSTVFIYDGWNLLAEYPAIHRSIAATTPAKRTYTWGLDLSGSLQGAGGVGGLLAVEEKASTIAQVRYPLYDGNGNVVGVDDGISAAAIYEYDAFGKTVYQAEGYADEMPFRFSTKYFDKETGFYYYGYRYYDPETGRWPSRDPIEENNNLNAYLVNLDYPEGGLSFRRSPRRGGDGNRVVYPPPPKPEGKPQRPRSKEQIDITDLVKITPRPRSRRWWPDRILRDPHQPSGEWPVVETIDHFYEQLDIQLIEERNRLGESYLWFRLGKRPCECTLKYIGRGKPRNPHTGGNDWHDKYAASLGHGEWALSVNGNCHLYKGKNPVTFDAQAGAFLVEAKTGHRTHGLNANERDRLKAQKEITEFCKIPFVVAVDNPVGAKNISSQNLGVGVLYVEPQ